MNYLESKEQASELLRMALGQMVQQGVAPTPINYTVWYEYVSGSNPQLKSALDKLIEEKIPLTSEVHQDLYKRCITEGERIASQKIMEEVQRVIDEVSSHVKEAGGTVSLHGEKIEALSGRLARIEDLDAVRKVVDFLVIATREILNSSSRLESKLSEATVEVDTLRQEMVQLKAKALTDALTGLVNRWGLESLLLREIRESNKSGRPLCVVLADIDHFKKINDTYGHLVGDNVIKMFAATLIDFVKGRDLVARFGGEEFLIVLPDTPLIGAVTLSKKMQVFLENMKWKRKETGTTLGKITLSFGVAQYRPTEQIEDLIRRADNALYYSKEHGRNRVTAETELPS